jgi:ABC-type polysaccharide/polyol phosphate transport system ATPase subunit
MTAEAIQIENVSKIYRLYDSPAGRLKEAFFRGRKRFHKEFFAVTDATFSVRKGTTVGLIGRNGSGKSTLLQIIAKIVTPTLGAVRVNGRVAALLELGSGFDPEFTGRENVYLNGSILGLTHKEIGDRFEGIEKFADIGGFMDQPVKLYSSGMYVRLAFATAVNVDPDILLVDEALAVGDIVFQHRCMRKIREIQEQGKTILFVSHDIGAVRKLCTEAILMDKGKVSCMGDPDSVIQAYYKSVWDADEPPLSATGGSSVAAANYSETGVLEPIRRYDNRFGSREGEIIAAGLSDDHGAKLDAAFGGQRLHFSILVKCHCPIDMPMAGIVIKDLLGNELIKTNTDAEDHILDPCPKDSILRITFSFIMPPFRPGSYAVSAGFGNGTIDHHKAYDWIENIAVISLEVSKKFYGLIHTDVAVAHEFLKENASKRLAN